ncbi:MAG: hypothetical protein IKK57_06810, partial [Clostridia bacterium]|nr:hypothetical protein [Clostridia bacterium]
MLNFRRILALCLALMMGLLACPARASGMEEHLLLDARMAGSCAALTGEIELLTIFVDLDGDEWDAQDMLEMNAQIRQAVDALEKDAASYGAQLSIRVTPGFGWTDTTITINQDDSWAAEILAGMDDMPGLDEGHKYINRPVLFLINDGGRSFASTYASDDMAEHAAVFRGEDAGTIRHELLHLFGARDFYIHDAIEAAAKTYFPDSIMLSTDEDKAVDSLTAYLVGWTSTPDAQAQRFLTDTRRITQDDISTAHEQNILSGYQTVESDGISYAGLMEDGLYHGLGTITWADGSTYTGDWLWGTRTGKGTYTWTNGCTYSGDYFNNERTGNGVYTWETGESYVGGFSNNMFDGKGIFTG